jgi:hypothetical protein
MTILSLIIPLLSLAGGVFAGKIFFSKVNKNLEADAQSKADEILKSYSTKTYRFKNRVCVISDDGNFRFDLTSLKMSTGSSFKLSKVLNVVPSYEIEVEYIGKRNNEDVNIDENGLDELTQKFISNISMMLFLHCMRFSQIIILKIIYVYVNSYFLVGT